MCAFPEKSKHLGKSRIHCQKGGTFSDVLSWGFVVPPDSKHIVGPREVAVCTETFGAVPETELVKLTLEISTLQMVMHI